jgi:carbon storage regulator CsrA
MLVLARQLNQRIVLPTVPATIEVVSIKPGNVRLGIDAPPEVVILREEVLLRGGVPSVPLLTSRTDEEARLARIKHILRNRLDNVALGLDLLSQQLQSSPQPGLATMIRRMEDEVRTLDRQMKAVLDDLPEPDAVVLPAPATATGATCLGEAEGGLAI